MNLCLQETVDLSVIIPAYNESANLRKGFLEPIWKYLEGRPLPYEVIIVDDGSTDDTVELVKASMRDKRSFRLIENPHQGKAIAVMTGLLHSSGKVAIFTDMDQATPIHELDKILSRLKNSHVVIGSRKGRNGAPLLRKTAAWGFSLLRKIILGLPYSDTQCGFKGFSRKAIDQIFPPLINQWQKKRVKGPAVNAGFDVEMLFMAKKKNLEVAEVPVEWHFVETRRVRIFREAYEAIKDILRIRFNNLR